MSRPSVAGQWPGAAAHCPAPCAHLGGGRCAGSARGRRGVGGWGRPASLHRPRPSGPPTPRPPPHHARSLPPPSPRPPAPRPAPLPCRWHLWGEGAFLVGVQFGTHLARSKVIYEVKVLNEATSWRPDPALWVLLGALLRKINFNPTIKTKSEKHICPCSLDRCRSPLQVTPPVGLVLLRDTQCTAGL